ncbi:retrovirus-related Pol polyprotein from transposon opus [Trichonephila clavipes]|nr:retrovirus-related Pol polyprotein from transposon opus [Trichonephila clavipes]
MEDAVELIHSIGRANIITTLDLLKGYWAIPMDEDSKNLTSFKTHWQQFKFHCEPQKVAFGKAQIKYLGHIIGSELVYPLTELTKKRVPDSIPWIEKHDSSFHLLKKALVEAPLLYFPVPDKPYTIHSDASQIGIAACLSQKCGDKCYPIVYASQKLSKTQQSWSTIEREAFAIVWSLKKFEVWVFGTEIEFYTDHNPLPYLAKSAPQSARLQRWAFALQKFNVTIKHCPGVKMPHADALSRLV